MSLTDYKHFSMLRRVAYREPVINSYHDPILFRNQPEGIRNVIFEIILVEISDNVNQHIECMNFK